MNQRIQTHILQALLVCDGMPMPEEALIAAAENLSRPNYPNKKEIKGAIDALYAGGYIAGATDEIIGTTWTLTVKGTHKARQL